MSKLYAAFGEFEIPVQIGTPIIGWIPPVRPTRFKAEPLLGNVAVLKNAEALLVLFSMDLLGMEIADCEKIREAVAAAVGTNYACVSISSTHSHSGPASMDCLSDKKDPALVAELGRRMVDTAKALMERLEPAVLGCGFTYENDITWNRRYILRDGSAWAHPQIDKMDVICAEGPIDPQVGVVCVRDMEGLAMGYLVNFACHPLFYGGQCIASPNYIGFLRKELKRLERPKCVCLFINGAAGDISHGNPFDKARTSAESVGEKLAQRSYEVALKVAYTEDVELGGAATQTLLKRRQISDEQLERAKRVLAGEMNLVIDPLWHPVSSMPNDEFAQRVIALRQRADAEPAYTVPTQALRIGDTKWAFCPGELFVRFGMDIKVRSTQRLTFVGAYSNGYIGYIFTPEAQQRGGYEPTPVGENAIDCNAGSALVDALTDLLEKV